MKDFALIRLPEQNISFPEVANGTRLLIEAYGLQNLTMLEEKDYKPLFDGTACNTQLATDCEHFKINYFLLLFLSLYSI